MSELYREADYHQAREAAQRQANKLRMPVGVCATKEYGRRGFSVQFLPRADRRQGYELRCEVVDPDPLATRRSRRRSVPLRAPAGSRRSRG